MTGRSGWVSLGPINMSGLNFIDLSSVGTDANEIDISLDGISVSATASLYAAVYNASGTLMLSGYYGYITNLQGSTLSGTPESPGSAALICGNLLTSGRISGEVTLRRQYNTTWRITSDLFDSSTRSVKSCHVTGNVGAGLTGIRLMLNISTANFKSGTMTARWRR